MTHRHQHPLSQRQQLRQRQLLSMPPFGVVANNKLYWGMGDATGFTTNIYRTLLDDPDDWSAGTNGFYSGRTARLFCHDRLNDTLYHSGGQLHSDKAIYTQPEDPVGGTPTSVATLTNWPHIIDCDPTNELIFAYCSTAGSTGTRVHTAAEIIKLNYDGSGETSLESWSITNDTSWQFGYCQYDLTTDRVYYTKRVCSSSESTTQLRYTAPDGTGDTLVYTANGGTFGGFPNGAGQINCIAIDVQNQKLFWTEFGSTQVGGSLTANARVRRANMDGSSVSSVYTPQTTNNPPNIRFCQAEQKLYVWDTHASTGKIKRMNGDGSSPETLVDDSGGTDPFNLSKDQRFTLGADFEAVGVGAIL